MKWERKRIQEQRYDLFFLSIVHRVFGSMHTQLLIAIMALLCTSRGSCALPIQRAFGSQKGMVISPGENGILSSYRAVTSARVSHSGGNKEGSP